jgi:hypothetical protein
VEPSIFWGLYEACFQTNWERNHPFYSHNEFLLYCMAGGQAIKWCFNVAS